LKISTVTFHCANNYGAVLQAYSLVSSLRGMGHDANVLDYWPKRRIDDASSLWMKDRFYKPVSLVHNFLTAVNYSSFKKRRLNFKSFRDNVLVKTERVYRTISEILKQPPDSDIFITGSDQVWNPETGVDPVYFLDFVNSIGGKSIAYAPSIGLPNIPTKYQKEMARLINGIDYLSSRERRGSEIIKELTGRNASTVVDPVFLQTPKEWLSIASEPFISGEYILVYAVRRREHMEKEVARLKKRLGLPVVMIVGTNPAARGFMPADKVLWDAGPKEFISAFANASFICTNSFHGTAFSLIFKKPFYSFSHTQGDSRASSILERADLKDRLIQPNQQLIWGNEYKSNPGQRLEDEICRSREFLKASLISI